MSRAWYNENDPYAAQWLRNLIAGGHLPPGDVDDRSIIDVRAADLVGYSQCHFFAGIGGWSHALRLAGINDDARIWTGSCPCQPLSSAGRQRGHADDRHLWPAFHALIAQCRPPVVFGEQVASKDGREWFAGVRADLEATGYACGAADLCAAGAGAPHIRQRLFWVADAHGEREGTVGRVWRGSGSQSLGGAGRLADAHRQRREDQHLDLRQDPQGRGEADLPEPVGCGTSGGLGDADDTRPQGRGDGPGGGGGAGQLPAGPTGVAGFWSACDLVPCLDGKTRRTGPGIFPLATGVPGRVGRLRAYGNAIVPQVAAGFIAAWLECQP